jgi:hypothetical protein
MGSKGHTKKSVECQFIESLGAATGLLWCTSQETHYVSATEPNR